jgi:acetylornithine deacetylase
VTLGDRAAELLAELVAHRTQQAGDRGDPGDEHPLCVRLGELLAARGADAVDVVRAARSDGTPGAYVFARWGTPTRIINAHVDTVPANAGWSRDPWTPHVHDGQLYALGSADTKGAIAATLVALEHVRPRDCGVLFSGDEEAGSAVMRAFLDSPHAAPVQQAIVCEPTARTAGVAHRGVLAQQATFTGKGGHSSAADHMPKPIVELAKLALALDAMGRARLHGGPPGMTGTCLNVAALRGGVAFNVVPERAELEWSIRPYPGFDRVGWDRELAEHAGGVTLATSIDHPPFRCDTLAELVRPHVRAIVALDFWTEAALLQERGIDAIVVGPGDIGHAHAADEHVAIADLEWAVELYRSLLGGATAA